MTSQRSDSGADTDLTGLGPGGYVNLPAGFGSQQVLAGHGILVGYSWENSGSADNSITAEGTVTGPAAGATIASVVLPQGTWLISWTVGFGSGAVAAADTNNMQLTGLSGGSFVAVIPAVANTEVPQPQAEFTGAATIAVKAIALATATAVYEAQIVATPVTAGFVRIFDGAQQAGLQVATSYLPGPGFDTQSLPDKGIELKRGLVVAATSASIQGTVWFIALQDD